MAFLVYNKNLNSKYDAYMASRHIDKVTHGNIQKEGWDNMEDERKELVSKACEIQAVFYYDNKALLTSPVKSLSLGSISMTNDFDNPNNFYKTTGVIMPMSAYILLEQAGLTNRII